MSLVTSYPLNRYGKTVVGWDRGEQQVLSVNVDPLQESMHLWDAASGHLILRIPDEESPEWVYSSLISAAWSPDRTRGVISWCEAPYEALVFSTTNGALLSTFAPHNSAHLCMSKKWNPLWAAWSPDGEQVVSSAWNADTRQYALQIWSSRTGDLRRTIEVPVTTVSESQQLPDPIWVIWSNDGQHLVSVNADGSIRTWQIVRGAPLPRQTIYFAEVALEYNHRKNNQGDMGSGQIHLRHRRRGPQPPGKHRPLF